jgi:hypothetical protein
MHLARFQGFPVRFKLTTTRQEDDHGPLAINVCQGKQMTFICKIIILVLK